MSRWIHTTDRGGGIDVEVLEESALAMAQSTIQKAINDSGISRSEIARKMKCNRSFISRMLSGNHNLTIKTMAKCLAACGFEVRFQPVRVEWNWVETTAPAEPENVLPANAGGTMLASDMSAGIVVPALA